MVEVQAELDDLFVLGLRLLARRSLDGFADAFVAMGLALGLDRDMYAARKAFQQLTTFNRVDRAKTRSAFLKAIEPLRTKDTSRGGQWTVVRMLNATGNEGDAAEASLLAEELRKDWDRFEPPPSSGWRQINVANPDVIRPSNMDQGLLQFVGLDVERMRQSMGTSIEDRNFGDFLPVAARFKPEAAIEKTRQVLASLLTRTDHAFRQVILNSEDHLPLVDPDLAANLIKRMQETNPAEALPEQEQSIFRMLAFYYAASQISADEQLKCMTGKAFGPNYILSVIPSLKLQPTREITSRIRNALQAFDEDAAHGALAAALHGQTPISDELEELIVICLRGASSRLRAIACELGIRKSLTRVRQAHVRSGWNATSVDDDTFEACFGSILLIEACAHGELPVDDLLKRISHQAWFAAAERLGKAFAESIAESLVERLRRAVSAACGIQRPAVDFRFSKSAATSCIRLSIEEAGRNGERFPKQQSLKELAGTDDDFYEKQSLLNSAAKNFFKELKDSDARLLVQNVTVEDLRSIFGEVSEPLIDLVDLLQQANNTAFVWLKNLAFAVASIISRESPESAVALMKRASYSQSFVTVVIGDDLTLEHQAIWGADASEPLKKFWHQRLLGSENDAVLAREVLAAERFGAANFIKDFILHLAASEDSLDQAYALLIAGYSIRSGDHADFLSNHIGRKGVPGQAAKHALSEHENALWARHWVEKMWEAPTPEEFWRCLIIAKTTMDARVSPEPPENSGWGHYAPVFRRAREAALKERNKVREKRLVGQDVPERVFVSFAD